MSEMNSQSRSGFTLVEVLFLLFMALVMLALIVPALQSARTGCTVTACMARIRGIPAVIRAYATNWNGWTHPDPDYYIKLGGHPLKGEGGYDPDRAVKVNDFVCRQDDRPFQTRQGYRSSYFEMPAAVGRNIMELKGPANRVVAAKERRLNHPMPGKEDVYAAHHAYFDCSVSLGPPSPPPEKPKE